MSNKTVMITLDHVYQELKETQRGQQKLRQELWKDQQELREELRKGQQELRKEQQELRRDMDSKFDRMQGQINSIQVWGVGLFVTNIVVMATLIKF